MKTTILLAATITLGLSLVTTGHAQPKTATSPAKGITIRKLPQGMTQDQVRARIAAMSSTRKAAVDQEFAKAKQEAKAIYDATAAERGKMTSALNADPRYKTFQSEATRIQSSAATSEQKATQMKSLSQQYKGMFETAMAAAKIDRTAMQGKIQRVAPGYSLNTDFSVRKSTLKSGTAKTASIPVTPSTQTIELRPPFTFEEFDADNQGIAYSDASADPNANDGKTRSRVTVVGLAGGGSATSKFGEFITVPEGVKRIEVIVKAKTNYDGNALGAIGTSISQASVEISVDNTDPNSPGQYASEYKSDIAMAPIAWYAEMEGGQSGEYRFSFDVPANKREYLIAGRAYAYGIGAGVPGYASANAKAEIDKITVKYHY